MKAYLIILILLTNYLFAQIELTLPTNFKVKVNDSLIELNQSWIDSLKSEAKQTRLHYQIAGYQTSIFATTVKLRIPQTLTFNQAIRQVILYYSLLQNDVEREKEKVLIYPYFADVEESEFLSCIYAENNYYFNKKKWETKTFKSPPTPEEKYIHNQILRIAMQDTLVFEEIPENAIKEESSNQNKSYDEIYRIYKKVTLWNTQKE
jgi:hypothetical protein